MNSSLEPLNPAGGCCVLDGKRGQARSTDQAVSHASVTVQQSWCLQPIDSESVLCVVVAHIIATTNSKKRQGSCRRPRSVLFARTNRLEILSCSRSTPAQGVPTLRYRYFCGSGPSVANPGPRTLVLFDLGPAELACAPPSDVSIGK